MRCRRILEGTLIFVFLSMFIRNVPAGPADTPVSLAGEWRFALDEADTGAREQWFLRDLTGRIHLPGVLQSQGYGNEISIQTPKA